MTLRELYEAGTDILDEAGIESPSVDAFYLLEYLTGMDRSQYLLDKERQITEKVREEYMRLIEKREQHVPYQYITGAADFMGFEISVTPDVLIPRLDTEVTAEETLKEIGPGESVLDMCTGSGCLAIAIKKLSKAGKVTACDISPRALEIAEKNAAANEAEIRFVEGDLFEKLKNESFDVIVSNPPYVTEDEYKELQPEVREHEPKLALTAGTQGMDVYERLVPGAWDALSINGRLVLEIGAYQAETVCRLMKETGFSNIKIIKDLAGLDRVVKGRKDV